MSLRKIIKEEIEGFDWIEDIRPSDAENQIKQHRHSYGSMYLLYFYPAITYEQCMNEVVPIVNGIFPNYDITVHEGNVDHMEIDANRPFAIAADVQYFGECVESSNVEECYVNELYGNVPYVPINGRHIFNIYN